MSARHAMHVRLMRAAVRGIAVLMPGRAERVAASLFFTPMRAHRPGAPRVEGLQARAFRVEIPGGHVSAWSWGEGPTVLLVHGWGSIGARMAAFVHPLVERGFRVVTFDLPAHGLSSGRQVTVPEMADAIQAVADVVGPLHAIVGHSLGGAATSYAVGRGLPTRRVVLLAPAGDPVLFARNVARLLGLSGSFEEGMLRRVGERLGARLETFAVPLHVTREPIPMRVFHDPEDREVPFAHGEAIAHAWPGAAIEAVHGVGHHRILTDAATVEQVAAFVSS